MKKLKIAYFGSPDFSAEFLEKLLTDTDLPVETVSVVTPPDKPAGRKGISTPVPVKQIAQKYNVPVIDSLQELDSDLDLGLLFAYGEILPKEVLKKPKHGIWNIHPSLLPLYRGAAPMATPLIEGVSNTGVTLMKMDEQLDHGPIIAQEEADILPKERHPELAKRLSNLSYKLFKKAVNEFVSHENSIHMRDQDEAKATFTKTFTKQDGFTPTADFSEKPQEVFNRFRGLYPWPGLWTKVILNDREQRLKITDLDIEEDKLIIKKVQLEGKKEVDYSSFKEAYKINL